MSDEIVLQNESGVMEIRLNRPEKMNAVTPDMVARLRAAIETAHQDQTVRCLLISAIGKAFCSGRDLASAKPGESAEVILSNEMNPVIAALHRLEKPTLAAVQGAAMGFGLGLAFACDVVYGSPSARFGIPFARLGAALDCGGHWFLSRRLAPGKVLEMIYSAESLDGDAAAAAGLIERCWPDQELYARARLFAQACANGPATAFARQKALLRESQGWSLEDVLAAEARIQGELALTDDYTEGITAFKARRAPVFRLA